MGNDQAIKNEVDLGLDVCSIGFFRAEVNWRSVLEVDDGFVEDTQRSGKRWLRPIFNAMLFTNLFNLWGQSLVVVVADAWEQVMLYLEVKSEREVECQA